MNKNTLIKIFSLLMIFAVIVSTVGCSGNKSGEAGVVDLDDLKQENGTAIYEGTKVNEEGKTEKVTQVIDVEYVDSPFVQQDEFLKDEDDKNAFIKQEGSNDYGMNEEEVKDVVDNAENWKTFHVFKLVENKSDKTMVCKSVKATSGDGIYVRTSLDAEYGIGPGSCSSVAIYATADMNKYKSDEELQAAFDALDIEIQYAFTDDEYAEIDDWENVTTHAIKF